MGQYFKGTKHGKGNYFYADGSIYDGDWSNNQIDGIGKYTWKDGKVY